MKLLLVTNDAPLAERCARVLAATGAEVDRCSSGREALPKLALPYDAYVFDWFLQGIDGMALTRAVRELSSRRPGVVLMSALTEEAARAYALGAGVDHYLSRPFSDEALIEAVQRCTSPNSTRARALASSEAALVGHTFWQRFGEHARRVLAEYLQTEIAIADAPPGSDAGQLAASLGMLDVTTLTEVHIRVSCPRKTGAQIAQAVLRAAWADEDTIAEMLVELCNTLLGKAKMAFRSSGFRFTLSVPSGSASEAPKLSVQSPHRVVCTSPWGPITVVIGLRQATRVDVPVAELQENMVLVEPLKPGEGEVSFPVGTRLTSFVIDRIARAHPSADVRVSIVRG